MILLIEGKKLSIYTHIFFKPFVSFFRENMYVYIYKKIFMKIYKYLFQNKILELFSLEPLLFFYISINIYVSYCKDLRLFYV